MIIPRVVIVVIATLQAGPSFGQAAEACGTDQDLLFHCTFLGGAKQVGLCYSDGVISYAYGPDFARPELEMRRKLSNVTYVPFDGVSEIISESLTFTNIDTTYEVFIRAERAANDHPATGGIVVTLPKRPAIVLTCDEGNVWPRDPFSGIGKLTTILDQ